MVWNHRRAARPSQPLPLRPFPSRPKEENTSEIPPWQESSQPDFFTTAHRWQGWRGVSVATVPGLDGSLKFSATRYNAPFPAFYDSGARGSRKDSEIAPLKLLKPSAFVLSPFCPCRFCCLQFSWPASASCKARRPLIENNCHPACQNKYLKLSSKGEKEAGLH